MQRTEEEAVKAIVEILRPFQLQVSSPDIEEWDKDATLREILREAAKELDMYGAGGCRLCMG
jgi:hypothetical protein